MAEENGRLAELMTEMLAEQKITNQKLDGIDGRVERLEKHEATTNLLLQQYGRDTVKLDERLAKTNLILEDHSRLLEDHSRSLERIEGRLEKIEGFLSEQVPHWGENITIETQTGPFTGWLRKAG